MPYVLNNGQLVQWDPTSIMGESGGMPTLALPPGESSVMAGGSWHDPSSIVNDPRGAYVMGTASLDPVNNFGAQTGMWDASGVTPSGLDEAIAFLQSDSPMAQKMRADQAARGFSLNAQGQWVPTGGAQPGGGGGPGPGTPQLPGGGIAELRPANGGGGQGSGWLRARGRPGGMPQAPGGGYAEAGFGGIPGMNPWLLAAADGIRMRTDDQLGGAMAGIRSNANAVGGRGGSRQGVAEGVAAAKASDYLSDNLTQGFFGDWRDYQQRELTRRGQDQQYDLGMGNLALGNRNTDLNAVRTGADLFQAGNRGWLSQGQGLYDLGTTVQGAPWQTINQFTSNISPYTGLGASTTTSSRQGGGAMGFLGGAGAGYQLGSIWGGGGSGGSGDESWRTTGNGMPPGYR